MKPSLVTYLEYTDHLLKIKVICPKSCFRSVLVLANLCLCKEELSITRVVSTQFICLEMEGAAIETEAG